MSIPLDIPNFPFQYPALSLFIPSEIQSHSTKEEAQIGWLKIAKIV